MVRKPPKVFISHASEDKERFVLEFGEKLRNNGIDAWVAEWEIKPGDKLIDKIFEEGINKADYFIIVLSENSVNKTWVREELDVATIRRIKKNTTIIPLVIDDSIEVPTALKHIVWVPINDLSDYDDDLEKIVMTIFGMDKKPPLNEAPEYVSYTNVPGLTQIDSMALKAIGDILIEKWGPGRILVGQQILDKLKSTGIPEEEISDSLEILESNFYLKITHTTGGITHSPINVNPIAFIIYYENFLPDFEEKYKDIISKIINNNLYSAEDISEETGCQRVLVDSIMEFHETLGDLKLQKGLGGHCMIYNITPLGKRKFREILEN
ncbi:MAG: toll/interleukin-1 receptor domain-containing protein [Methanobacterium paludis]|nr:toll/interleukin-1 receptor domain-containing protein [Methanobacterium paludis]